MTVYHNEQELLSGLQRGETMACTCMLKHFARRLHSVARRMVNSDEEAEEVVQESFIRACEHLISFEGKSELSTWLYRIVVNTALMHRRRHVVETLPLPEDDGTAKTGTPLLDDEGGPDILAIQRELQQAIDAAIAMLPETLRKAFVLRHVEGLSTKLAAETLGIEESALKVRVYRARQELRSLLATHLQQA